MGSCSAVAQRLRSLEAELTGLLVRDGFSGRVRREHIDVLSPIDDVRATREYRIDASRTLVERALHKCVEIG